MQQELNKYMGMLEIPIHEYHNCPGVSRSALMKMRQSPFHYWYEHINPTYPGKKDSDALVLGNAIHTYLLEPNKFNNEYHVSPKHDRRTKEGKAAYESANIIAGSRTIINEYDFSDIMKIGASVLRNEQAKPLIRNIENQIEQSIFWEDKQTGLLCKARPDIIQGSIVVDLKSTESASYRNFQSSIYKYGYHIQAAMAKEALHSIGIPMQSFVFVAVEKKAPYASAVYLLDDEAIETGLDEFRQLLSKTKSCLETNIWPSYEPRIISLPKFVSYITEEDEV